MDQSKRTLATSLPMPFAASLPFRALRLVALVSALLVAICGAVRADISFRTIGGDDAPTGLYYEMNKQDVPVSVIPDIRSQPYVYNGPSPLVFYTLQKGADGKMSHVPFASVDLLSTGSYPLFFFFKDPSSPARSRILTMKEDAVSFPESTFRIVNFSKSPVEVTLGNETLKVPTGGTFDKRASGTTLALGVVALTPTGPVPVLKNVMPNQHGWRYLLAICPSSGGRYPVEVKNLQDNVPSPAIH
jgi:hypothetical protein